MATLKVNLTAVGNACDQDATPAGVFPGNGWYIFLNDCHGNPFVHAGKEYGPIPVDHGYAEVKDVPPGRYLLFAIVNPFPVAEPIPGGEVIFQANYASHFAVVDVCCGDDDIHVTLYNSGWHYCVQVIIFWYELLMRRGALDRKIAQPAIEALNQALRSAGQTLEGDAAVNKHIEQITRAFTEQKPRTQPKSK